MAKISATQWKKLKAKLKAANLKKLSWLKSKHAAAARPKKALLPAKSSKLASAGKKTTPQARKSQSTPKVAKPDKPPVAVVAGSLMHLEVGKLYQSPLNPREDYDAKEIAGLAASLEVFGVISPLLVRPDAKGKYEVVAGNRRLLAAKKAKLKIVPCLCRAMSDAEVLERQVEENARRVGLNPIEEAKAFKALTQPDGPYTQRELAERFGTSQPQVANRIRLLELPELWQQRVISEEISVTHARDLIPWVKYPQILKELETFGTDQADDDWDWSLFGAIKSHSRNMETARYEFSEGRRFTATPEQMELLDVVDVKCRAANSKRAMNVTLYDELQQQAIDAKTAKDQKKIAAEEKKPATRTAAEQKEADRKQQESYEKRLRLWVIRFKQGIIADVLSAADQNLLIRLVLFFAVQPHRLRNGAETEAVLEKAGGKLSGRNYLGYTERDWWESLGTLDSKKMPDLLRSCVQGWISHDVEASQGDLRAPDVEAIYSELGRSLAKDWRNSREFLDLHNKHQLCDLALEWKSKISELELLGMSKGDLIEHLLEDFPKPKAPAHVLKLKPVKGV